MKKIMVFVLFLSVLISISSAVSIDLKTKFAEKIKFSAIKVGTTYFLYKDGINISDVEGDCYLW